MEKEKWQDFALLLIDVQSDFWDEEVRAGFPEFPDNIRNLVTLCRSEGIEIIHIRAQFSPDEHDWMVPYRLKGSIPCISGTLGEKILDCAAELEGEKVIYKQTFDSFCNPELKQHLLRRGKKFLLTAGLVTSICVLLTTASAVQNGFLVSLVNDCSADLPDAHFQTLQRYEPIFMPLVTVDQIKENRQKWLQQLEQLAQQAEDIKRQLMGSKL